MSFTHQSLVYRFFGFLFLLGVSLLSGYIGGMSAQVPISFEDSQARPLIIERPVAKRGDGSIESLYKRTQPLIVAIATGAAKQRVTSSMIRSYATILTSDGWIVSTFGENLPLDMLYGIRSDGSSARLIKRVADPTLGVEYFKMEGSGMGSADFLPKELSFEARNAYVVLPQKVINRVLTIRHWYPPGTNDSLIRHSDLLEKSYLTASNAYPNGSPVFTEDGQLLGLVNHSNIIPSFYIQDGLKRLLRNGRIERISLKLSYIDLAATPALLKKPQMGAMIVADKDGVFVKGRTTKALLRSGEIITKVNAEEINENQSLSELLAQYSASDEITLTVIKTDGKEQTLTALSQ